MPPSRRHWRNALVIAAVLLGHVLVLRALHEASRGKPQPVIVPARMLVSLGSGQLISRAQYSLDALGRRTRTQLTYAKADGSTFTHTLGQDYNADGQLQSHTYPDGSQQSYSYAQGRLAAVTLPDQSQIGYGSYQWMVPGQIDTPGSRILLSVDALQRLSQLEVRSSDGQTLASSAYQYDQAGNITQIKSDQGQTDYGYDKLDRLIRATPDQRLQALGLPVEQYSYDAAGNRTSSAHQPGAWRYNRDNQLTQYPRTINPNIPGSQTEPTDVSYTAQGHTESESSPGWQRNYRYNAAERLIEITQGNTAAASSAASLTVSYRYDPFGRRTAKTVTEGPNSQTTYYLNGDSALLAEANEAGQITKAYGFNPATHDAEEELWSTDPVWQADIHNGSLTSSQTRYHYITTDHLGTPILATNKSGNKTWRGYSQAFGHTGLEADNSTQINLRFPDRLINEAIRPGMRFMSSAPRRWVWQSPYWPVLHFDAQAVPHPGRPLGLDSRLQWVDLAVLQLSEWTQEAVATGKGQRLGGDARRGGVSAIRQTVRSHHTKKFAHG